MNIAEPDAKAIIQDAYYNLFIKAMRGQECSATIHIGQ